MLCLQTNFSYFYFSKMHIEILLEDVYAEEPISTVASISQGGKLQLSIWARTKLSDIWFDGENGMEKNQIIKRKSNDNYFFLICVL